MAINEKKIADVKKDHDQKLNEKLAVEKKLHELHIAGTPQIHNGNDDNDDNNETIPKEKKTETTNQAGNCDNMQKRKPDALTKIYRIITCGGKENANPTLLSVLKSEQCDDRAVKNIVKQWVDSKSKHLLDYQASKTKKGAKFDLDFAFAPSFRGILTEFKEKAKMRTEPVVLTHDEKFMVLNYLGLFSDCSEYNKATVETILLGKRDEFRPMLLRLPSEHMWTWLWSFLNTWVSLAYLIIGEELNENHVYRFLFLEEALFAAVKYYRNSWMKSINVLHKDMKNLVDGTAAFASYALNIKREMKCGGNNDIDWHEIFNTPLNRADLYIERLKSCVQKDVRDSLPVKTEKPPVKLEKLPVKLEKEERAHPGIPSMELSFGDVKKKCRGKKAEDGGHKKLKKGSIKKEKQETTEKEDPRRSPRRLKGTKDDGQKDLMNDFQAVSKATNSNKRKQKPKRTSEDGCDSIVKNKKLKQDTKEKQDKAEKSPRRSPRGKQATL